MGGRQGKTSRSKVVVMFKTTKAPVTRAYDLVAEVVRLGVEVVGDRKDKISRNKVDGHDKNF